MSHPTRPLWIARVAGTQAEMGRQHGALVAAAGGADATVAHYRDLPAQLLTGDVPAVARPLVAAAIRGASELLLARLEAHRPAPLVARSRAFMTAAGQPPGWSRYLAVMDLFQNYVGVAARLGVGPFAAPARAVALAAAQPACSTAIVWGAAAADGTLRHARNFDFPGVGVWDATPAIVVCQPTGGQPYAFITTRGGDTPVVTVWNQAGLVFTSHTRFHREVCFDGATIVDLIHGLAAEAQTLADVERLVRGRRVASSWGVAVSSWRERAALSLELHGGAAAVVRPAPGADQLIVANRYRDPAMTVGEVAASPAWVLHSDRREARLRALVAAAVVRGGATVDDLVAMLTDRVDPAAPDRPRHLGGVVAQPCQVHSVVVEPAHQRVHLGVAAAPVGVGAWATVEVDWAGPTGAWEVGRTPIDVGVRVSDGPRRPRPPGTDAVARAMALEQSTHDQAGIAAALAEAIAADPDDPSLRMAMAWTAMRQGEFAAAQAQVVVGLRHETLSYRRGQLLLWGARAATAAGADAQAQAWRAELAAMCGPDLDELQAAGARDRHRPARWFRRRPSANLFMMDAIC
ncbi:MAG: C45 family autoproteolytic acyltransferase/hydrolase [Kofleriaceae bacterium]